MKISNRRVDVSFKVMDKRSTSSMLPDWKYMRSTSYMNELAKISISPSYVNGNLIRQTGLASFNHETEGKEMKEIYTNTLIMALGGL